MLSLTGILSSEVLLSKLLLSCSLASMYMSGVGYLRIFDDTRLMIRLVSEVIWSMRFYCGLLALLFIAYTVV